MSLVMAAISLIEDRSITTEIPQYPKGNIRAASHSDNSIRAFLSYLRPYVPGLENRGWSNNIVELVDVRSPKEFTGEILAPPEYPTEQAQRGGHIPGAKNIPWSQAVK